MKKTIFFLILATCVCSFNGFAQGKQDVLACATRMFSKPNCAFMHKIVPAKKGVKVFVDSLPTGLKWNERRQLIEGIAPKEGFYTYYIYVPNGEKQDTVKATLTVDASLTLPTPFMGWISWNVVEDKISSNIIKEVAKAFDKHQLKQAGYNYIIIDDLWHAKERETDGRPKADEKKFDIGMKATIDFVHHKGLKFGIYSDAAEKTCAGAVGSIDYETIDAKQYAQWGVDLLKYDYCHAPVEQDSAFIRYKKMGDALKNCGKNITLYMCEWGVREPWKWAIETGSNAWRCTYDTRDCWKGKSGGIGILESLEGMKDLWPYSGVNRFNDADMMCVGIHGTGKSSSDLCDGKPGMTYDEYQTQFALWCMWSSPLLLSFDLTKPISKADKNLMTNKQLIALNQDALGLQAEFIEKEGNIYYFMKDLANGDVAISATNVGNKPTTATFDFNKFSALNTKITYKAYDCINQSTLTKKVKGIFFKRIKPHATLVYRLSKK